MAVIIRYFIFNFIVGLVSEDREETTTASIEMGNVGEEYYNITK